MDIKRFIRNIPKVELHRHLCGAGRSAAMFAIAQAHGGTVEGGDIAAFRRLTSMDGTAPGFHAFLAKFKPRARFIATREYITELTRSVIKDAEADNLIYLELRFSASHFARHMGFDVASVSGQIMDEAEAAAAAAGMALGFIMVLTRDLGVAENRHLLDVALEGPLAARFAGVDLAGDEATIPLADFTPLVREARAAGKHVTIHAGEAGPAANVAEAIAVGAERIGHGIRCFGDEAVLAAAVAARTAFEVCPTSNLDTASIRDLRELDLKALLDRGVRVTLNTDDPGISNTTLVDEYLRVQAAFDLGPEDIRRFVLNAVDAAFLSDTRKRALRERVIAFNGA